jgi:twinkle protein
LDVWDFAKKYLYPYKVRGDEITATYCPICKGGEHHDKGTFSINSAKLTYHCLRGSCGVSGHFKQLCDQFGEQYESNDFDTNYKPRQYKKPNIEIKPMATQTQKYMELRKISKETLEHYGIGDDGKGNIIFPYYENGELVFVKYRPARKVEKGERKAWRESDTKPILFGIDLCDPELPLVITEGEIDSLSCYESGIKNVVSVPSGTQDMTWLDTCWNWLKQFNVIILYGDSDNPGRDMVQALIKKLSGEYIIKIVQNPEGIKDANELLFKQGKDAVKAAVENAKEIPVTGIIRLADVKPLDVKNIPRTLSNIKALDSAIGGFLDGELTVWTGKRGHGKSTLVGQLLVEAVEQRKKVCAYSGELRSDWFKYWIECQMAGPKHMGSYHDSMDDKDKYFVKEDVAALMRQWYLDYFYLYDNEITTNSNEESSILKVFEHAVKRYDCKVFLVDNLMTAQSKAMKEDDYYRAQSNFVGELVTFAKVFKCHVHLVAHPKKVDKASKNIDCDDVSGIGDITNRAHNVLLWTKIEDDADRVKLDADGALKVLKNRSYGATSKILFKYDECSRRLYHRLENPYKEYGWIKLAGDAWEGDAPWETT